MGLLRSVRVWLNGEVDDLSQELRRRGATRELWRYAAEHRGDVHGAWSRCPRAPWCLEIAARCDVDRTLIRASVEDLVQVADGRPETRDVDPREWGIPPALELSGVSLRALRDGSAAAASFVDDGDIDAFCVQMEALSYAIVEADRQVRETRGAIEEAQSWGRFNEQLLASDRYDEAYAAAHATLAGWIRRRIPGELVVASLHGRSAHPYR